MRPISRWRHMMSSTVTVAARSGIDADGAPSYGTAVTYRAHISRKNRLVSGRQGEEIDSGQAVYLDTNAPIQTTAKVTLSTGDVGSTEAYAVTPKIVAVERRFDQIGAHHVVIYFE